MSRYLDALNIIMIMKADNVMWTEFNPNKVFAQCVRAWARVYTDHCFVSDLLKPV